MSLLISSKNVRRSITEINLWTWGSAPFPSLVCLPHFRWLTVVGSHVCRLCDSTEDSPSQYYMCMAGDDDRKVPVNISCFYSACAAVVCCDITRIPVGGAKERAGNMCDGLYCFLIETICIVINRPYFLLLLTVKIYIGSTVWSHSWKIFKFYDCSSFSTGINFSTLCGLSFVCSFNHASQSKSVRLCTLSLVDFFTFLTFSPFFFSISLPCSTHCP